MTVFLRVLERPNRRQVQLRLASSSFAALRADAALGDPYSRGILRQFSDVPGTPFAYWAVASDSLTLFRAIAALRGISGAPRLTHPITEDSRFVRAWWEVAKSSLASRGHSPRAALFSRYSIPTCHLWILSGTTLGDERQAWRRVDRPFAIDGVLLIPQKRRLTSSDPGLTWPRTH